MIKLVIADDHLMLREGFKTLLRKEANIQIVGEAENGRELLQIIEKVKPDVVITDIQMPLMGGVEATKRIRITYPKIGVIALTMYTENSMVIDMLKAGAKGYLTKNTSKEELIDAIDSVYAGENYFSNDTSPGLTRLINKNDLNPFRQENGAILSKKEISIIQLICQEYSTKQIAPEVHLTKRTVDSYREKIQEKIGAKNVVGIALYAIKNGLFALD